MGTGESKEKKERKPGAKTPGRCCGTLRYLAECRGTLKKMPARWQKSPDGTSRVIRAHPAAR